GSGLYLAGPALVKAAIGQEVSDEELGGAAMHAQISGTIDFREKDDESCLVRLRSLVEKARRHGGTEAQSEERTGAPLHPGERMVGGGKAGPHKAVQMPGVIYDDSADKAARFILDCNQRKVPIIFLHDTTGFMVGRDSEQGGIIRAGAKMVNAMSNSVVPKIVVILGGSYGAGNYAMCGRAFDQLLSFAWPCAKCAVMGANQATGTLATIEEASRKRKGETIDEETRKQIQAAIHAGYTEQADIRHGA